MPTGAANTVEGQEIITVDPESKDKLIMKIAIYGFGTTPVFFKSLIDYVSTDNRSISWCAILPTSHHLKLMRTVIPDSHIKCIHKELPLVMAETFDLDILKNYPRNIYQDIETEKITLKHRESKRQIKTALATYKIIKRFMVEYQPDYVLYAQPPEGMDGVILAGVAEECRVKIAVPHHTRHLGRSFFSNNVQEHLPSPNKTSDESLAWSKEFVKNFRYGNLKTYSTNMGENLYPHSFPNRLERTIGYLKRLITEPENRELGTLRVSLLNSWMPAYRDMQRGIRKQINKNLYNCKSITELPKKFLFYPLQYSPESSINVPAPYFIDQLRIIDGIRMAMPNEYQLVIKEHPVCLPVRNSALVRSLLRKAGVIVANSTIDTQELIKKSDLVITVTGTAALEALLWGKPSFTIGPTFFSEILGGSCNLDNLSECIRRKLKQKINDEEIIAAIQKVYTCSAAFIGRAPDEPLNGMMTTHNIDRFWEEFTSYSQSLEDD